MWWARVIAVLLVAIVSLDASAVNASEPEMARRIDLADTAAGTYFGDVVSDSRGASQSDVTITVEKIASGIIRVSSSYERLPTFSTRLTRAMSTVQQSGQETTVFLLDL